MINRELVRYSQMQQLSNIITQVVFGGLFGADVNRQLNLSAVQFVHKICEEGTSTVLTTTGPMLKQALLKSVQSANNAVS